MKRRRPPMPPGWMRQAARGETALLAAWEPRIDKYSRRVYNARYLGMGREDVAQDLRMVLYETIRRYAWDPGGLPPDCYVSTVLYRRWRGLVRNSTGSNRVSVERYTITCCSGDDYRSAESGGGSFRPQALDLVSDPDALAADEALTQEDVQAVCEALVYGLRRNLSPAAFAVLHLRYAEEWSPMAIEKAVRPQATNGTQISRKLSAAKKSAGRFLWRLGIDEWADVALCRVEEFDHEID